MSAFSFAVRCEKSLSRFERILYGAAAIICAIWLMFVCFSEISIQTVGQFTSGSRLVALCVALSGILLFAVAVSKAFRTAIHAGLRLLLKYKWIVFLAMVIWQLIVWLSFGAVTMGADQESIKASALDPQQFSQYLSRCPNNVLIAYVYWLIAHLAGFSPTGATMLMQLLVIIVLDACIASCVIVFSLISKRVADISFVLLMLSLGFSGYVILVYTDILSLPFSFVSIYAGLKIFRITLSNENKSLNRDDCMRVCMYGLLLGCASFFGYQMKASSIIPVIAFIVTISVSLWHKQVKKAFISLLLAVAVGFSVCAPIFHFAVNNQMKLNYDDSYSYPMSHFMAMGMRNRGGFSFEDRVDVDRYASKSEKNEYSLSLVERRLKDYGISGYSAFLLRKMYYTYSDGSFTFGQQDSSFEYVEPSNGSMFRNFRRSSVAEYVRSLYTVSSNSSAVIKMLSQFMIAILAFGILFFSFYALKKSLNAERSLYLRRLLLWLILALLGSFAFLMLFESGRSKYLIQFLPIYVLMASIGLNAFQIQLRKHMEK